MRRGNSSKVGLTLVESVIAMFIISGAILIIMRMVTTGLNANLRAEQSQQAALIASKQMESIRKWARAPANFYLPSWSTVANGTPTADPDNPDFTVVVEAANQTIASPCSQEELRYPTAQQRQLTQSFKKVVITVSWAPGGPRHRLVVASLLGAPEVPVNRLLVTPDTSATPVALSPGQAVNLTVAALDGSGNPIPDHLFSWTLSPTTDVPSVGSYQNMDRGGTRGQYENFYMNQTVLGVPTAAYGPAGNVSLLVTGRSPAVYDSGAGRYLTNVTDREMVRNQ